MSKRVIFEGGLLKIMLVVAIMTLVRHFLTICGS